MSNGIFNEAELERAIIELFEREGYEHLSGDEIHRALDEVLLLDDLREFISTRYAAEHLSDTELQKIVNKLSLINSVPLYAGNREAFFLVNEGFDLPRDDFKKVALHVEYIDFDEPAKNIFKVVSQFSVEGDRLRRPDLLIYINGIPIAICEFKSAIREDATIHDAWEQIFFRYSRDIPKLLRYNFLAVISDGANTKFGSVFTPYENFYSWNKVNAGDEVSDGISSLFTMVKGAFSKARILQILRDFIFYPDDDSKSVAVVCRYPQFFAATKMLANIKKHLRPIGDGKGGTYFGATGCGKTFTMLFLSRLLIQRDNETFHNPTIIILTDREDLDTQTSELFVTAKKFLHEQDVRSIESRADLRTTLKNRPSGGVYVITIQKFCEELGELSARENIICISDEAHRTQTNIGAKLKMTDEGTFTTYGFAHYLRKSFPKATYCGFTGTPIDETIKVFGDVVDSYTMKESCADGITVRIAYEPRLARVAVSDEQAREIEKYYDRCAEEGSTIEQINASKIAMSKMTAILSHPERIKKLAADIVGHYERLCAEKPKIVQKAMIVCADRKIALKVLQAILSIRPAWGDAKKSDDEKNLSKDRLQKLVPLPKINLVATQGQNDPPELFNLCGTKDYRKKLDKQFKNDDSNFKVAVVVDMWITGFDVPSLAVMYIDKPLQKHTLIQTISRVNRVFDGKDKGLVVDYIGFKNAMLAAVKKYGSPQENPVDELKISLNLFRNYISLLSELMAKFDTTKFFSGSPLERLNCLNDAAEFVQTKKDTETRFMSISKKLKAAYAIVFPSGELSEDETAKAQFFLAIRSIIFKQTKASAPDSEIMNRVVEKMVEEALNCTGIENIVSDEKSVDLFSEVFRKELDEFKMPITKFNALLKLAKKNIAAYGRTNKIKSIEFDKRLKKIV
ncbi:MAG: type I restriction endonuclease subunit R, partial [Selenomonadaceae bacterium]|nr:type I restriction endonuclease subunit R [Selenomonadaceae bacterium]